VLAVGVVQYTYKAMVALGLTPALYLVNYAIDRYLGEPLAQQIKHQATKWN
jgi:hypothetical protein